MGPDLKQLSTNRVGFSVTGKAISNYLTLTYVVAVYICCMKEVSSKDRRTEITFFYPFWVSMATRGARRDFFMVVFSKGVGIYR